mmetsp:Transcript_53307/g.126166  ORF Transcript_53307/g.126166 Transcript_53307/m.126166 type:complete len:206 (+) Transcript_53307:157-774(+)
MCATQRERESVRACHTQRKNTCEKKKEKWGALINAAEAGYTLRECPHVLPKAQRPVQPHPHLFDSPRLDGVSRDAARGDSPVLSRILGPVLVRLLNTQTRALIHERPSPPLRHLSPQRRLVGLHLLRLVFLAPSLEGADELGGAGQVSHRVCEVQHGVRAFDDAVDPCRFPVVQGPIHHQHQNLLVKLGSLRGLCSCARPRVVPA